MIYTLNARGNVMLPVMREMFELTDLQCYEEINSAFEITSASLNEKGIEYKNLKPALIPVHGDRYEVAFIFDSDKIDGAWYGYTVFEALIPYLNKESTYSILQGDIITRNMNQYSVKQLLFEKMIQYNDSNYQYSSQYYVVYINNLTKAQTLAIAEGLKERSFFVGYIDMTFNSIIKTIFAYSLAGGTIKYKNIILQAHEADRDEGEDINTSGFPYEENNFIIKSISDEYFNLFLNYKIEALINDIDDIKFSFNSIYPLHDSIFKFQFSIPDSKLVYLQTEKSEVLKKLDIIDYSAEDLKQIIVEKIEKSYLYNLEYLEDYDVPKFNISLELDTIYGQKRKVLVALKYVVEANQLQLITMY